MIGAVSVKARFRHSPFSTRRPLGFLLAWRCLPAFQITVTSWKRRPGATYISPGSCPSVALDKLLLPIKRRELVEKAILMTVRYRVQILGESASILIPEPFGEQVKQGNQVPSFETMGVCKIGARIVTATLAQSLNQDLKQPAPAMRAGAQVSG